MDILETQIKQDKQCSNGANYIFDIETCLDCFEKVMHDFPKQTINKFPENLEIENTPLFYMLLERFNRIYDSFLSVGNILNSKTSFNAFYDFVFYCSLNDKIEIVKSEIPNFMRALDKIRSRYNQNLRSSEKYYDKIFRKIYAKKGLSKGDENVKKEMYRFEQSYSLMKLAFENEKRNSGERYFEHLKGVMDVILDDLENPNINKVVIALLHDVQEDLPEYADVIRKIYGNYIADGVDALSKKDWKLYLDKNELEQLENCKDEEGIKQIEQSGKERRNQDYFGHLNDLCDDYLDVKFADRIHNLRDISSETREKIIRKVQETEKYFLDVAKRRNPKAYNLMMIEIGKIRSKFKF